MFSEATFQKVHFQSSKKIVLKATIHSLGYAILAEALSWNKNFWICNLLENTSTCVHIDMYI